MLYLPWGESGMHNGLGWLILADVAYLSSYRFYSLNFYINLQDFKNLKVWELSHALVLEIYKIEFPQEELYGLSSQIRRAGSSIPTNIAEGCGRGSDVDFKRFIQIAFGSACELEYLLILCKDLSYISGDKYSSLIGQIKVIKKMLATLIKKLKE